MENRIYAKKKGIEGQEREKIKINEAIIHIRIVSTTRSRKKDGFEKI